MGMCLLDAYGCPLCFFIIFLGFFLCFAVLSFFFVFLDISVGRNWRFDLIFGFLDFLSLYSLFLFWRVFFWSIHFSQLLTVLLIFCRLRFCHSILVLFQVLLSSALHFPRSV